MNACNFAAVCSQRPAQYEYEHLLVAGDRVSALSIGERRQLCNSPAMTPSARIRTRSATLAAPAS
jgi:hypothetical protein